MATTVTASETTTTTGSHAHIVANLRPARQASRQAVVALMASGI